MAMAFRLSARPPARPNLGGRPSCLRDVTHRSWSGLFGGGASTQQLLQVSTPTGAAECLGLARARSSALVPNSTTCLAARITQSGLA